MIYIYILQLFLYIHSLCIQAKVHGPSEQSHNNLLLHQVKHVQREIAELQHDKSGSLADVDDSSLMYVARGEEGASDTDKSGKQ